MTQKKKDDFVERASDMVEKSLSKMAWESAIFENWLPRRTPVRQPGYLQASKYSTVQPLPYNLPGNQNKTKYDSWLEIFAEQTAASY